MSGQGSAGNTIAALASFFVPGLGQLIQGRGWVAFCHIFLAVIIYAFTLALLGWVVHVVSCLDAAKWKPIVK